MDVELKKSSMAFQLKNGEVLLISNEDVAEIANKLIIEMMINKQNQIIMYKSTAIEKCNLLYKIVIDQKEKMTDDIRNNYFKAMLELIKDDEKELTTLKKEVEKQQQSK